MIHNDGATTLGWSKITIGSHRDVMVHPRAISYLCARHIVSEHRHCQPNHTQTLLQDNHDDQ